MTSGVKICGLTTPEAVIASQDADYVGFIFYPSSPRNLTPSTAATLAVNAHPKTVAVTVDADDNSLQEIHAIFRPAYFQLHGNETPARVLEVKVKFGVPVIKAIKIASGDDAATAYAYEDSADMLLFDARPPKGMPGGNGVGFDWRILAGRSFSKPWFLSGGLDTGNVVEAMHISGAEMVDVSSSLESAPGVKDPKRVREFVARIKSL
jgi:phosphoribosylanthranilate isomerase